MDRWLADYKHAVRQSKEEKLKVEEARKDVLVAEEGQQIVQQIAQSVQESVHKQIAGIVTRCLQAVFVEPYEFKITFDRKRGRTEARCVFVKQGHEIDPQSEDSGGVNDVASFALRLACLMLTRPPGRRFLALDEAFSRVHADTLDRLGELLIRLSQEFSIQILLVTHQDGLQVGKVIHLT